MKSYFRAISLLLVFVLICGAMASCTGGNPGIESTDASTNAPEETTEQPTADKPYQPPTDEYTLPLEDGYNQLTLYWNYNGTYENCDVWIWWGDKAGQGYLFHECAYGAKVVINVPEGVEEVGFIVRRDCSEPGGSSWGNATKDYDQDRFAIIEGRETIIYLKSGDASQYKSQDGGKTLTMIKKFSLAEIWLHT